MCPIPTLEGGVAMRYGRQLFEFYVSVYRPVLHGSTKVKKQLLKISKNFQWRLCLLLGFICQGDCQKCLLPNQINPNSNRFVLQIAV